MTLSVTHRFVSQVPDAADANLVRPISCWNDTHVIKATGPCVLGVPTNTADTAVSEITWNPATFGSVFQGILVGLTNGQIVWQTTFNKLATGVFGNTLAVTQSGINGATPLQVTRSVNAGSVNMVEWRWINQDSNPAGLGVGDRMKQQWFMLDNTGAQQP